MIIQRLCEISEQAAAGAVELLFGAQITGKQSREDIRNFIAGRCFDDGRFMRVAVENGRVVATGGAVVAEVHQGQIFITAMAAAPGSEAALNDILRQILADITVFPGCAVKLGIGGEMKVPDDFPGSFGFSPSYSLLQMKFNGRLPVEEELQNVDLVPLGSENISEYVVVTNAGFAGTPNAGTIDTADAQRLLENQACYCGLIKHKTSTVGCYELKLNGSEGWIESVSLLPASRGQGLGRATVARLICQLHQLGSQSVKLTVIDANENAYSLYKSMAFTIDLVLSRWYVKN